MATDDEGNLIAGSGLSGVEISYAPSLALTPAGSPDPAAGAWIWQSTPSTVTSVLRATSRPGTVNTLPPATVKPNVSTGNQVLNNLIGLKANGAGRLPNQGSGVMVYNASSNKIGGATGTGNVIASNQGNGVTIMAQPGRPADGNTVEGNYIGTDKTGTITDPDGVPGSGDELGNQYNGVAIGNASSNTIGGTTTGARNVIAGNAQGILITDPDATQNKVIGNAIGTDVTGVITRLGNLGVGVAITNSAWQNSIGGTQSGEGNLIVYNGDRGVVIGSGNRNKVISNTIYNQNRPLDLGNDGFTPNDPGDADAGANNLQNSPVITGATGTMVTGTMSGITNTTFRLEFYSYQVCDPLKAVPGFGDGKNYLLSKDVQTGANGNAAFTVTLLSALPSGYYVAATATDPNGNTSEFSNRPFQLRASSPSFAPKRLHPRPILLYIDCPSQAALMSTCLGNLDLYVVANGDTSRPLKMDNDAGGLTNWANADLNANDVHYSLWYTPTQAMTYTLDLYVTSKTKGFAYALASDKLTLPANSAPRLAVLTDWRALWQEFHLTKAGSPAADSNGNLILDYYDAVERMRQYAAVYQGVVLDVRQDGYAADYDYQNDAQRALMPPKIDWLVSQLPEPKLYNIAIIGDDAVVPFYRYVDPLANDENRCWATFSHNVKTLVDSQASSHDRRALQHPRHPGAHRTQAGHLRGAHLCSATSR